MHNDTGSLLSFPEPLVYVTNSLLAPAVPDVERALLLLTAHLPDVIIWVQIDGGQLGVAGAPAGAVEQSRGSEAWYLPADTASWRLNMLTIGNLPDASFRQIK